MSTFRPHIITGQPVLFAPGRAARPHAFEGGADEERCPFCAGHESDTPPPLLTIGDPWRVRVFPNKYPSVAGAEVIVESPLHDVTFDQIGHAPDVVDAYLDRYRAHSHAACVSLFKNEGPRAGSSIPHVHSQVMPLPFVPPRIRQEGDAFAAAAECPLCIAIETHRRDGLVIRETEAFAWIAPSSSSMAYQQWIVPKRHVPEMTALTAAEQRELAPLLRAASAATLSLGGSMNWIFVNFPRVDAAHFYVDIFPRVTAIAGFELGTGTFVEIIDPAAAARRLRN